MPRRICPKSGKDPHVARQVYAEVTSPKKDGGTGRSTKVPLPFVWCGEVEAVTISGHVVGIFGKARHGIVALDVAAFAKQRRTSAAATAESHGWGSKPKRKKAPAQPSASKTAPKPKPKARTRPTRRAGPSRAIYEAPAKPIPTPAAPPTEDGPIPQAGQATLPTA